LVNAAMAEGYTLAMCAAPACSTEQPNGISAALRACVWSSRHGVLVVSGCCLGAVSCRLRSAGPLVLMKPCDVHRRPTGPVVCVGPLRSDDDIAVVQEWIRSARFDPALLPPRLVALHRTIRAAMHN
jgi:hypothetical protein